MILAADWISAPGSQAILARLSEAGHGAWFVGGCVRDGLLNVPVDDIDIATSAQPEVVRDLLEAADMKVVPTGIEHGTVTVVAEGVPYEITTLRRDISTDGRRATVAFTTQIEEDAARRDFTMNALYATADGTILDPNGEGLADLKARRVRFIGHPEDRIHEDYLRILRFFRFVAWYADAESGLDADGLAACAAGAEGIERLSRERVGTEIKKLMSAPDPAPATAAMAHSGVLMRTLPGADPAFLPVLVHLEDVAPNAMRRLAILGGEDVAERLRLSKADGTRLANLRAEMAEATSPAELGYRLGAETAWDVLLLRAALSGMAPSVSDKDAIVQGAEATFPIKAADLMPALSGPALGQAMKRLETRWIASGFALTREALLAE